MFYYKRKNIIISILFMLIFICGCVFISSEAYAYETEVNGQKTVTVAYYSSPNFQEGVTNNSVKSGYSYDYLQKISGYTGWKYKYIYGRKNELLEKFLNGEIDIYPGIEKCEEHVKDVLYSEQNMNVSYHYIFTSVDNDTISSEDLSTLKGKKVGCIDEKGVSEHLRSWIEDNNLEMDIVFFTDITFMMYEMKIGNIDCIASTDEQIDKIGKVKEIVMYSQLDTYFGIAKDNEQLQNEINDAVRKIDENNPLFKKQLYEKYYENNAVNAHLTNEEREWLKRHKEIKIGYIDDYIPLSDKDEKGNVTGVVKDIFKECIEELGISKEIYPTYIEFENTEKMIEALEKGEIDAVFPVYSNTWNLEKNNMMSTENIVPATVVLIYSGKYNRGTTQTIAISNHSAIQEIYAGINYPDSKICTVNSASETLDAVKKGNATCTIFNSSRAEMFLSKSENKSLKKMPLSESIYYSIGVRKGDAILLELLNKGIGQINKAELQNKMYNYVQPPAEAIIFNYVIENIVMVSIVTICIFTFIIFIFVMYVISSRKRKKADELKREALQNQMSIIQSVSEIYFSMHLINLNNDSFKQFIAHGLIEKLSQSGNKASEVIGKGIELVVTDEYYKKVTAFVDLSTVSQRLKGRKIISYEFIGKTRGWIRASFITISVDGNDNPIEVVFATQIIEEEKNREEALILQSNTDQLTGCFNRRAYVKLINGYSDDTMRDDFTYFSLDVNGLKGVNDNIGHAAGDELLVGAAQCISRCFGEKGKVFRTGGDEFVVIIHAEQNELDELISQFELVTKAWKGEMVKKLFVSYGYAAKREYKDATVGELATIADKKMYENKSEFYCRNGVSRESVFDIYKDIQ